MGRDRFGWVPNARPLAVSRLSTETLAASTAAGPLADRRSPVPGDRRAVQVTLTDTGQRAAAAFHAELGAELSRLISPLAPHDREQFRSTMAEIIARCRTSLPDHC